MGSGLEYAPEYFTCNGQLALLSFSPMYHLMPLMTLCGRGDLHAEKGMSASMWADCKCIIYALIILG